MRNGRVLVLELLVMAVALPTLYRTIVTKNGGIPRKLIAEGHQKLHPLYRKNVDRSVGGWLRRVRVAGESWARAIARGKVMA